MSIGIFYSSFNNYQLLEHECLDKIDFQNYKVINIDDHSCEEQKLSGKRICKKFGIPFLSNKGKGLQFATKTAIDFFSNDKSITWVLCLQQDVKPLGENFFRELDNYLSTKKTDLIGAIGFNMVDDGKFTPNLLKDFKEGQKPIGWLGTLPLSDNRTFFQKTFIIDQLKYLIKKLIGRKDAHMINVYRRWFAPNTFKDFNKIADKYSGLSSIDIPAWPAVLINVKSWNDSIEPDKNFIFHLWFNDIAFQFMKSNFYIAVCTEFYFFNDQKLKTKYGMLESSADEGRLKDSIFAEKFGNHLTTFKGKWHFCYENIKNEYHMHSNLYKGTLIDKLYNHDCMSGPLKKF